MIGIFDSGSGGLTVLSEIMKLAPNANIIYFGDIKNVPYGKKTQKELCELTLSAIKILKENGASDIVSACNSVSQNIVEDLAHIISNEDINVIEMTESTTEALSSKNKKNIAVLGTVATIDSKIYQNGGSKLGYKITGIAIENLAEAIERGESKEKIKKIITTSAQEIIGNNVEVVMLGCTQFPLVEEIFKEVFDENGLNAELINPAVYVAKKVVDTFDTDGNGKIKFLISEDSAVFRKNVEKMYDKDKYDINVIYA